MCLMNLLFVVKTLTLYFAGIPLLFTFDFPLVVNVDLDKFPQATSPYRKVLQSIPNSLDISEIDLFSCQSAGVMSWKYQENKLRHYSGVSQSLPGKGT